jgi:hypothetical protein
LLQKKFAVIEQVFGEAAQGVTLRN